MFAKKRKSSIRLFSYLVYVAFVRIVILLMVLWVLVEHVRG